jgi:DnaJ-class molecular chaperone
MLMDLNMTRMPEKLPEQHCPACDGRGIPAAKQPARPGRRIYPAPCKKCGGKGRIAITD